MNQLLYLLSSKEAWNHKNFYGPALIIPGTMAKAPTATGAP